MIHHTSGMYDLVPASHEFVVIDYMAPGHRRWLDPQSKDHLDEHDFYARLKTVHLQNTPGRKFSYSNVAYFLLSRVVEQVTGSKLRGFADTEIFDKLGMNSSFFNDDMKEIVRNRAQGYSRTVSKSPGVPPFKISRTKTDWVGDGGVFASIEDFLQWDRNFYANKLGGGSALIKKVEKRGPNTGDQHTDPYAFGMFVGVHEKTNARQIWHDGAWVGFTSYYVRFPELRFSVVLFCNSTDIDASTLGDETADVFIGDLTRSSP